MARLRPGAWANTPLLGFDVETTGTDPYSCRMADMALVLDRADGSAPEIWSWVINPECDIPLEATAVHGISTVYARQHGITVSSAVSALQAVLDGIKTELGRIPPVCVYNAPFDIPVIMRESGGRIAGDWLILDALVLDRLADPYRPGKRTLTAVSAAYGLCVINAHRAAGDCVSAINLTRAIGRQNPRIGNASAEYLQEIQASAYRRQMTQFRDYRRKQEPDFECPLHWPYDPARIKEEPEWG